MATFNPLYFNGDFDITGAAGISYPLTVTGCNTFSINNGTVQEIFLEIKDLDGNVLAFTELSAAASYPFSLPADGFYYLVIDDGGPSIKTYVIIAACELTKCKVKLIKQQLGLCAGKCATKQLNDFWALEQVVRGYWSNAKESQNFDSWPVVDNMSQLMQAQKAFDLLNDLCSSEDCGCG